MRIEDNEPGLRVVLSIPLLVETQQRAPATAAALVSPAPRPVA
jgi:hypothetical protein